MLPFEESHIEKRYYKIGEVAKIFKVAPSLIRFWESEFQAFSPKKSAKGNRIYTQKDIEVFKMIYHLVKEKGYTLQGAKEALKLTGTSNESLIESLKEIKKFLIDLKTSLDKDE